ncbi:hypothetical protein [Alloalcanivorax gelatiniphagus]|uniref:Multidrug transporter n=1 Tax=Alloalcanivorax gelatiniphagus TaxID=1194167 RepID=A0ABY2XH01_9GAMM|nr:hypothetical protein [Alloalcanivorax gelatiniphagus]TMW10959.1 hypothetical protein FGS76_16775 [Alloalcanivorax gelatiniphagus]
MKRALRLAAATALASTLSLTAPAQAREMDLDDARPSALAMFGDALIVRPVMTVATVGGAAIWLVTLPFSVIGGNPGEAADTLVKDPAATAFVRCLGCTPQQHDRLRADKRVAQANEE